jgi:mannose-6-phosphate isomerase-like protein (cupin superfamily)
MTPEDQARRWTVKPFFGSIEALTLKNEFFRHVVFTGKYCQLVLMCLEPGEEIGREIHPDVDQFFRLEQGEARFVLDDGEEYVAHSSDAIVIPAGTFHNVINSSRAEKLKLYTLYAPPNHPDGTIQKDKQQADAAEAEH